MSRNVLIVDDSTAMRKVIRRILMLSNFETRRCFEAGDGVEALDVLETEPVDLVLTDINMPRMNGEELVRRLAADARLRGLPVVVISTDGSRERLDTLYGLGARGYITKPFVPETLGSTLNQVFGDPS